MTAQKEALNWLFTLNIGGVAGILTYASAKGSSVAVIIGLSSFSVGLISLMYFAVVYYYEERAMFNAFKADVFAYDESKLDFGKLVERENARPDEYKPCVVSAWISLVCALSGVVSSAIAILN